MSISEALGDKKQVSEGTSVRFQLTLKARYASRVEAVRVDSDCDSYTDVFRDAFDFYELARGCLNKGGKVVLEEANGDRYLLPIRNIKTKV